jgi:hypothetical protein
MQCQVSHGGPGGCLSSRTPREAPSPLTQGGPRLEVALMKTPLQDNHTETRGGCLMKKQILMLSLCGLMGFLGAGCGGSTEEPAPQESEQVPFGEQPEATPPADDSQSASTSGEDGGVTAMAKNCKTTCTGTNNSSGATCGVVGFGSTTFLGGCTKACRFARQDADTKAQTSGCSIQSCNDEC